MVAEPTRIAPPAIASPTWLWPVATPMMSGRMAITVDRSEIFHTKPSRSKLSSERSTVGSPVAVTVETLARS